MHARLHGPRAALSATAVDAAAYREFTLTAPDSRHIEALWQFAAPRPAIHSVLPDGRMDILAHARLAADGRIVSVRLAIAGPMSRPTPLKVGADSLLVGVRFRPGWGGLCLGLAPTALRDRVLPHDAVAARLGAQVRSVLAAHVPAELRRVLLALARRLARRAHPGTAELRALGAVTALHASAGRASLGALARNSGVCPRSLRRDIGAAVGLPPKTLAAIVRFRHCLALRTRRPGLALAELAASAGYSDQSHMTREFRILGGFTPSATPPLPALDLFR